MTSWLLLAPLIFCVPASRGESALFKAYFEQREVVATVFFDRNSGKLDKVATAELEAILSHIRQSTCDSRLLRVEGFSGREGTDESAFRRSLNLAYSVANYLESQGIPCLAGINGYGDLQAPPNGNGKQLRVEIAAYPKMFIFDFAGAKQIDLREVTLP